MELHPIAIFPDNYKKVLDNYAVKFGRRNREKSQESLLVKEKTYLCTAKTIEPARVFAVEDKIIRYDSRRSMIYKKQY